MRGLQLGAALAQSVGVLQAAQRRSGQGGLVFWAWGAFRFDSMGGAPNHEAALGLVVRSHRRVGDIAVGSPGNYFPKAMLGKTPFFNGLLGAQIFEDTEVEEIQESPLRVKAGGHFIDCGYLVVATHTPLTGINSLAWATLFQTKLYLYTSYAVRARIPNGAAIEASFWDTADPYNYLRIDQNEDSTSAILGGEDHKSGQGDPRAAYARLANRLKEWFPKGEIDSEWSGQVIETPDGLPYIGETGDKQFVATGFAGNGMTFGTLGAMMAVDALEGRPNPWRKVFDVNRKKAGGTMEYLAENKDYPYYLLRDWIAPAKKEPVESLAPGEGKILNVNGKKAAAYRDEDGKISVCSAICTHLKCVVRWNAIEKTWDCPCHGSRFAPTGEVLAGPAEAPLEKIKLNGQT